MSFPYKYLVPPLMEEAALICETGFTPTELAEIPEELIQNMTIYLGVKQASINGGNLPL